MYGNFKEFNLQLIDKDLPETTGANKEIFRIG